jgi:hypothetical protein
MDRKYVMTSLVYAIMGLLLGLYMAASKNHGELVTHAHIMLIGFVVSFVYALIYKLWLGGPVSRLGWAQYYVHHVGSLGLFIALFLLYGGMMPLERLDPFLALFSILVFVGMLLMTVIYIKTPRAT